ncbi:hypothetical protein K1T71_005669 [Dendrolimus kikuchii]|uniref:Uncharacterized protein n=1 Tax=Dendrolimus kikuchii TaxID=765133 RepID=A0ACC1D4N0_9NEOP|nr:hypothetical protein K1T71_005669 [Dendrolimus kikuchii]
MLSSELPIDYDVLGIYGCKTEECYHNLSRFYNLSHYNFSWPYSSYICVFESPEEDFISSATFHACVYIMYITVFLVALTGNGLVCFVVQKTPRMKTVTNYFIMNLAVGDILMTLFCVPFSFVSMLILRYWPFGALMCKIVNYSQAVSVFVSAYTLLAISIDRYIIVMRPLKPRLGKTAAKLVVAAVWIGALITAAPIPIVSRLQKPSLWHEACQVDICSEQWTDKRQSEQYTFALLGLQFALPLCVLVYTYARIAYVVWCSRPPGEAHTERDSRLQLSKRKMVKMMVTVVTVFTMCWLPLNIFIVLWTIHEADEEWSAWPGLPYLWFASHWLAMSHSCYNPIIYCYMNAKYRRGFEEVLNNLLCLKLKNTTRSCRRSSVCDGVPLSEMVGAMGSAIPRRVITGCKCHPIRGEVSASIRCTSCSSLSHLRAHRSSVGMNSAPARALSVRAQFP